MKKNFSILTILMTAIPTGIQELKGKRKRKKKVKTRTMMSYLIQRHQHHLINLKELIEKELKESTRRKNSIKMKSDLIKREEQKREFAIFVELISPRRNDLVITSVSAMTSLMKTK
jgi:hypothetical protein